MVFDSHKLMAASQEVSKAEEQIEQHKSIISGKIDPAQGQAQQVNERAEHAQTLAHNVKHAHEALKKHHSIKDLAKLSASQTSSMTNIKEDNEKIADYSLGYEPDTQENEEEMRSFDEESQHDEKEDAENDNNNDSEEDNPKEDLKAPAHEVKIQKIGDKTIHAEFSRGLKQGLTSIKTKEGHYEMQAYYAKDKLDGPTTYYYPDGKIEREINFQQGEMHGLMKSFHEDGKTAMEIEYEHGIMHGMSKIYDEFGKSQIFSTYKKGKLHGEMIVFSNGKPYLKKIYHEGSETHQQHDPEAAHSC